MPIGNGLPNKSVNVVVEDAQNGDLLFVGNDQGVYVSIDSGAQWIALKGNMPTVPVHDLVIHPRENDLVVGTYGRGLWVTDIGPLREMDAAVLNKELHVFRVKPKTPRGEGAWGNYQLYGDRYARTANDPDALAVVYYMKEGGPSATVTLADNSGKAIRSVPGPAKPGINRAFVSLTEDRAQVIAPGDYIVTIKAGNLVETRSATIRAKKAPAH